MIRKNLAIMFTGRVVNVLSFLGVSALISRSFGDSNFGLFSFFTTVTIMATFVACFGLDVLMVREASSDTRKAEVLLSNVVTLKFIFSVLVIGVLLILFSMHTVFPEEYRNLFFLVLAVVLFNSLAQSLWWVGDSFQKTEFHSFLWAGSNVTKFIFVGVAVAAGGTFSHAITAFVFGEIVSLIGAFFIVQRYLIRFRFRWDRDVVAGLVRKSWPIGLGTILSVLIFRVDVLQLQYLENEQVVAWYSAAGKFIEVSTVIPSTITLVLFPVLSARNHLPWPYFFRTALKGFVSLGGVGISLAAVFFLLSTWLIPTIYGPGFGESVGVLRVIAWSLVFIFLNTLWSYLLVSYHYAGVNTLFHVLVVGTKIGLNFWLIPAYHHLGPAYSTLIAEGMLLFLYGCFLAAMRMYPPKKLEAEPEEALELISHELD